MYGKCMADGCEAPARFLWEKRPAAAYYCRQHARAVVSNHGGEAREIGVYGTSRTIIGP